MRGGFPIFPPRTGAVSDGLAVVAGGGLGTAAINHATVIKVRAERRLADIVDAGQARGEIATQDSGINQHSEGVRTPDTLADLGIERQRLAEARLLRDGYTEAELDQRWAGGGFQTATGTATARDYCRRGATESDDFM